MSQINNLISNYRRFMQLPWQQNVAGAQRVWFAVYPPSEERRIRARIKEFELAALEAKKRWHLVDITHFPAHWLGNHEYHEGYFDEPSAISNVEQDLRDKVLEKLKSACEAGDPNTIVAVIGVGSLFGLLHVSSIISELDTSILGRLLIFFPGEYERNLYRFMDARDGFNYMAVPITCGEMMNV